MDAAKFLAGLRVLAVDDDRINLAVLKRVLKLCNYNNVTTVTDASTALDMLRARKDRKDQFGLVISDVFMPDGINGFKLLELISLEMDIPVIMLSANDEMETMVTGIKHGACDYFVKPVRLEHVRNIWMHVVGKNSRNKISNVNDDAGQKLQYGDDDNAEKDGANHTGKHSKKSKKVRDDADKDKDKLTQKKQRIHCFSINMELTYSIFLQ
ncbi:two-component response regulator ORR24-like [Miscanthus floridulus]|uniref:two-component response regulator ORR24-like n=1 Tax=Miscanthus floridulus TaxID=154761 RepID=UPI00345ABB83